MAENKKSVKVYLTINHVNHFTHADLSQRSILELEAALIRADEDAIRSMELSNFGDAEGHEELAKRIKQQLMLIENNITTANGN